MGRGDLARNQERRVLRQREHHFTVQSSKDFYNEAKFYETNSKTVERATQRAVANEKVAAEYEIQQKEAAEASRVAWLEAQRKAEADKAAAEESKRVEEEQLRTSRQRKAIINASPELLKIKAQIEAAKIAHQQRAQLKEALLTAEMEEQNDALYRLDEAQQRAKVSRMEEKIELSQKAKELEARLALQAQLRERDALKEAAKQEVAKEKAAIQEMVERERQQEAAQRVAQAQRQRDLAAEAASFMALQKELKERQRAAEAKEERKIQEYLRIRKERQDYIAQQRAERKAVLDEDFEKARLAAEAEAFKIEEEEEALLDMLHAEMDVQRAQEAAIEASKRRANQKKELLEARDLAAQVKKQRAATEAAWEAEYCQKLVERMAEEDKIAAMNATARRLAVAEHLREAARCVALKKRLVEAVKEEEDAAAALLAKKEAERKVIIEEERIRLLEQAAAEVFKGDISNMPRGILERPEDLNIITSKHS